jgi:hypothetical protein
VLDGNNLTAITARLPHLRTLCARDLQLTRAYANPADKREGAPLDLAYQHPIEELTVERENMEPLRASTAVYRA